MSYLQHRFEHDKLSLCYWERPGQGLPLLFSHATSFHGRIWSAVIDNLPDRHCYAIDHRGHGQSDKPEPPKDWMGFGMDLAALARHLGLRGAVGIGHSMGGHSLALAASLAPECFSLLLLIDPTIQPREWYTGPIEREHGVEKRRNQWASADEMYQRFENRPPFSRWQPRVLRDYCDYGLVPAANGEGFQLGCPPLFEAGIYKTFRTTNIYPRLAEIAVPVHIVRVGAPVTPERNDMSASPTATDLYKAFPRAFDIHLPNYSHFLPMEAPEWVAAYIRGLLSTL